MDIRRALASCDSNLALWRTDDQGAIVQLAALLVSGRVKLCGGQADAGWQRSKAQLPSSASAPARSTAVPIGSVIAPASRPATPAAPVAEEPAVDLDVAAMVLTLRAAAKDGTPFCEECARAARQAA
jgi:hypothetical protein